MTRKTVYKRNGTMLEYLTRTV